MRCTTCRRTGFTEPELGEHESKTGHVRPADRREWASSESFPEERKQLALDPADLLEALRALGPAARAELQKLLAPTTEQKILETGGSA